MIEPGTFLQQRYRIARQIGQGGMGAVYIATDERFNSTVAIKETLFMDENFRKAIEREARLLNSLKHAALPRVSDHFIENEGQFLVMEYIQGEDLYAILERDGQPFPVETVLSWADQLLDALDYLHNQADPVIHRDIKPQNLKVTARGQIVLLDFGLAKGNPTDAGMNTAAKSIFGYSRNYASLEQIQGTGTDPRSDLYSLAATLYHLITNRPPDDALTRAMSVLSHKGDLLQPANQVNPAVPAGVAGVLQKALALNAGDRPATAADMKAMLQQSERFAVFAVGGGPIAPTRESPLFAQPTRLMSDDTQAADPPQTDIKTEVLPVYESQLTAVRDTGGRQLVSGGGADSFAPAGERRKRFGLAAAAATVLLAVGVIAGGVLVLPGLMEPETPVNVSSDNTAAPQTQEAPVADSQPGPAEPGLVEGQTAANTAPEEPSKQTAAPKAPEQAAKTGKTRTGNPAEDAVGENNFDFEMNDNDVPETVVITRRDKNGKLHTTRITPGARPPNVPDIPPNFNPFPPGFDPSKQMTPAEREQLKQLMRQRIRQQTTNSQPPQE